MPNPIRIRNQRGNNPMWQIETLTRKPNYSQNQNKPAQGNKNLWKIAENLALQKKITKKGHKKDTNSSGNRIKNYRVGKLFKDKPWCNVL